MDVKKISSEPVGFGPEAGAKSREEPAGSDDVFGARRKKGTQPAKPAKDDTPEDDVVDEASKDSFPASDPPSWPLGRTPDIGGGTARPSDRS